MSFEESLQLISSVRSIVRPNLGIKHVYFSFKIYIWKGFVKQLKEYHVTCACNRILKEIVEKIEHKSAEEYSKNERIMDDITKNQVLNKEKPDDNENLEIKGNTCNDNENKVNILNCDHNKIKENEVKNENLNIDKLENVESQEIHENDMGDIEKKLSHHKEILIPKENPEENSEINVNDEGKFFFFKLNSVIQVKNEQKFEAKSTSQHETQEINLKNENKIDALIESKGEQINIKETEETKGIETNYHKNEDNADVSEICKNDSIFLQNENDSENILENKEEKVIEKELNNKLQAKSNNLTEVNEKPERKPEVFNETNSILRYDAEKNGDEVEEAEKKCKNHQLEAELGMSEMKQKEKLNNITEMIAITEGNIQEKIEKKENIDSNSNKKIEETNKHDEEDVKEKFVFIKEAGNIEKDELSKIQKGLNSLELEIKVDHIENSESIDIEIKNAQKAEMENNKNMQEKGDDDEKLKKHINLEERKEENFKEAEVEINDGPQNNENNFEKETKIDELSKIIEIVYVI